MDQSSFERGLEIGLRTALVIVRQGEGIGGIQRQIEELKELQEARANNGIALNRSMEGAEQRTMALSALASDETERRCDVERGIFQNIEMGLMRDNGDGTYSLTDKGTEHVSKLLRRGDE